MKPITAKQCRAARSLLNLSQPEFAEGYRTLFEIAWDTVAKDPK